MDSPTRPLPAHGCSYELEDGILFTFIGSASNCEAAGATQGLSFLNGPAPLCCDAVHDASGLEGLHGPRLNLVIVIILYTQTNPTQTRASSRPRQSRRPNRP